MPGGTSSDPIVTQNDNKIDIEAAEWVARLDAGAADPATQRQLNDWLAGDSRRLGAFIRARAQWADLDRLGALAAGKSQSAAPTSGILCNRRALLVAGVAGLSIAAASWLALRPATEFYKTEIGEMRRIALADGSTLVLNTDSEARVRFETSRRSVQLLRGEGLFDVVHDPQRPFIVMTGNVRVRAIGTVFSVRLLRGEQVNVTVSEGVVELAREAAATAASPGQRIAANQQSIVTPTLPAQVQAIGPDAVQRRLAWLEGKVAFDGESLQAAVAEINRHSHRVVVVDDAQLSEQPIVGVFRATDAQGFCRAAAAALGASVVEDGERLHLRSRIE